MPELETPTAPPPAASPPPPASPAAAPESTTAPVGQSFDQSFPDDGLDDPVSAVSPEAAVKPALPAGDATTPKPPEAKPQAKPEQPQAKPEAPQGDFAPPQVAKPNELRAWAQRMGTRAQKAEGEIQKLHSKLAQLETQGKQSGDVAALAKELDSLKQRYTQAQADLELTKFERSERYQTTYQKPYQDAVAAAYRDVKELLAYEPNPEDPDSPAERAATQADFDEIYGLPLGQATRLAKSKFGDAAPIVLQHRAAIRRLAEAAYQAVEEQKAKGGEFEAKTKAEQAQHQEEMSRLFTTMVEAHAKQRPDLFQERDGDTEGNELLAKGKQFANSVFGGNDGLTQQQIAFRDGAAFNRMAAFPRVLRDNKRLKAELAEATKTIEALRGSGPGAPTPGTPKKDEAGYKPFDQAFDELPG